MCIVPVYAYVYTCLIAEKIHGRKFRVFALEQVFCGINCAICVLVVRICIVILTISQINFCEFHQIVKNAKYKPYGNFPLYCMYKYKELCTYVPQDRLLLDSPVS